MSEPRTFLAEAYAPSSSEFARLEEQARSVAGTPDRSSGIRHLRSILVREDEMCLHLYEAPSLESLRTALDAGPLRALRIVEVSS